MTAAYLDTSAAVKLLVEETELRRFAVRHAIPQQEVTAILDTVSLYDMPHSLYYEAGILPGRHLRSLDAVHLVAAVRLGTDVIVSYDNRLQEAAAELGLGILSPVS